MVVKRWFVIVKTSNHLPLFTSVGKIKSMKKITHSILILFFFLILSSCSKEKVQISIPDPPQGTYEIIAYNANNQVVFTRKATAFYNGINQGTQIRLDDPDFLTQTAIAPNDVFASLVLQTKQKLNRPLLLNYSDFTANIQQRWYSLPGDWSYQLQQGSLEIKEVSPGKIKGEFSITLIKIDYANPKWGETITIKGKFYANCYGNGC